LPHISNIELDDKQTRVKAEQVLKRARAGEDFAALAKSSQPISSRTREETWAGWQGPNG
jgi:hypothetical protein